jgi:hypothetical protein
MDAAVGAELAAIASGCCAAYLEPTAMAHQADANPQAVSTMRLSPSAFLVALAAKERTTAVKLASLAAGSLVFLVVLPAVIFFVARSVIPSGGGGALPRSAELVVTAMFAATGLSLVAWAALEQWSVGHGTPTQTAPTRHLVTTGPYALCRNPDRAWGGAVLFRRGGLFRIVDPWVGLPRTGVARRFAVPPPG